MAPPAPKKKMTASEKLAVLESLTVLYDAAVDAESARRRAGFATEADTIGYWADRLMDCINDLRGRILDDWIESAKALAVSVEKLTSTVRTSIDDLKKDQETAKKVLEIAGVIDDAIKIASQLRP